MANVKFSQFLADTTPDATTYLVGYDTLSSLNVKVLVSDLPYQDPLTLTTTGSSGAATLVGATLNIPEYTLSGLGGVPLTRTITINGTAQDLSADRTWNVGTVTSVASLTLGTSGTDLSSSVANGSTTPVITLNVPTASATNRGALSAADWSTFNNKQNAITLTTTGTSGASTLIGSTLNIPQYQAALTNPVTGTGTTNYLSRWSGLSSLDTSLVYDNGSNLVKTVYSSVDKGLKLSFDDNAYVIGESSSPGDGWFKGIGVMGTPGFTDVRIGDSDYDNPNNLTYLEISDAAQAIITYNSGVTQGLKLDFANNEFWLGDSVNGWGLLENRNNGNIEIGDFSGSFGSEIKLHIGSGSSDDVINTSYGSDIKGFKLDFVNNNGTYSFGDVANNGGFLFTAQSLTKIGNYDGSGNAGTSLYIDDGNEKIYTQHAGIDKGLKLDFANSQYKLGDPINDFGYVVYDGVNKQVYLGDYNYSYNGSSLGIDDTSQVLLTKNNGTDKGLKLDFANNTYKLGDYDFGANHGTSLIVDDTTNAAKIFTRWNSNDQGLYLDFGNSFYNLSIDSFGISCYTSSRYIAIGDYNDTYNACYLFIDDSSKDIRTIMGGNNIGLKLDFLNQFYALGDYNSTINGTFLKVDDGNQLISFHTSGNSGSFTVATGTFNYNLPANNGTIALEANSASATTLGVTIVGLPTPPYNIFARYPSINVQLLDGTVCNFGDVYGELFGITLPTTCTTLNLGNITGLLGLPSYNVVNFIANSLLYIRAGITISSSTIQTFTVPNLKGLIGGALSVTSTSLTTLNFPKLEIILGNINLSIWNNVNVFNFPELKTLGGQISISGTNTNILTYSFPKLKDIFISNNNIAISINQPNVQTLDFSALENIYCTLAQNQNIIQLIASSLTTINLSKITNIVQVNPGSVNIIQLTTTPNLTTFDIGTSLLRAETISTAGVGLNAGNFNLSSCALNQASVDNILVQLAKLDGTNGTTLLSNRVITITGTSSAPSATGNTAKATLVARGCIVTTN